MTHMNQQFAQKAPKQSALQTPADVLFASLKMAVGQEVGKNLQIVAEYNAKSPDPRRQAAIDRTRADMNRQAPAASAKAVTLG